MLDLINEVTAALPTCATMLADFVKIVTIASVLLGVIDVVISNLAAD